MKRVFSVTLRRSGNVAMLEGSRKYEVVAPHATDAIDKATARFRKEESWRGGVLVEYLTHRGAAI